MFEKYFSECWYDRLKDYLKSNEFIDIAKKINQERSKNIILPPQGSELLFKAFRVTPYEDVKCVIIGQDPYHGDNQYDGLSFSNSTLDSPQPSLSNILEEVENDVYDGFNLERLNNFSLYSWAEQGILMINAAHTVVKGKPGSHMRYWKKFTEEVVKALNEKDSIVWLLWGRFSQTYEELITNDSHLIIKTSHPSPLGISKAAPIPFRDSKCFSKVNDYLWNIKREKIIW